ncbi:hypothetical protein V6U90_30850 [Micromonospora sp. CPCC 206060]|uniref:hypothetical protein n=1 Tax=Micromonospora sp. CPCC 206060 TaxID=3122406 RepID=UPI002FF19F52
MTSTADRFPARHLPPVTVREMPPPPRSAWRIIGPGVIAAGVGLASGEFVLYPYIASQVGLVFLGRRRSASAPSEPFRVSL